MSLKKLLVVGFITFALTLSGCFTTDSDDDDDVPIDSVDVQTALDSLATIAGTAGIDSSMKYVKSGNTFTLTDKDTASSDDTITFTATVSGNTSALVMTMDEDGDTITVTMNSTKIIGTGSSFDGTAWQLSSLVMKYDTLSATYTLGSTEIIIFYLTDGTTYMVEAGISIGDIFDSLANKIMVEDSISQTDALDTLASLAGSTGIDSLTTYIISGNTLTMYDEDTMSLAYSISSKKLTMTVTMGDMTLTESFNLLVGAGSSIEESVWQLESISVSNTDTSASYTLTSSETVLLYLKSGKLYEVENGIDLYDDVMNDLFDVVKGFGDPIGNWGVVSYYSMYIDSGDTSYYGDSVQLDSTYNIFTISSTSYKNYSYDNMEIEVNEILEDFSKGGTFVIGENETITVIEDDEILTITLIVDYTKDGYGYREEEFICQKYAGTIPPNHWVTDTADTMVATPIAVGGAAVYGILDSTSDENWYSFTATAGKYYAIEAIPTDSSSIEDLETIVQYIESSTGLPVTVSEEGGDIVLFKAGASIMYYVGISSYDTTGDYTIKIKELDIIATPTAAIGNWWVNTFIEGGDTNTFTSQDATMMYAKVTADSVTFWMNEGTEFNEMSTSAMFTSDNKMFFGDMEFSYATTDTSFRLFVLEGTEVDIDVLMAKYVGDVFPPAGVISRAVKLDEIKLFE